MFIAYAVVGILLAAVLTGSAVGTFTRQEKIVGSMTGLGVPESWLSRLATLKSAGAVGLIVGLWVPLLGVAAAIGVILYFIGAAVTHLRAKDYAIAPVVVILLLAVAALVLRLASV
ncbi:DoxX family protein [Streptomyces scopuliridis]|uniref:Membrane protein n=1 Tax=Streptomyces scopuliridis RB72 TaxID=1440053 RepID=A0A2T7TA69_9ACTN|nr:DoxX family protein [Streptomyces scopuliridis]PVE12015.1 membrane protein [Streptomyces scopuliridis RB72]